MDSDLYDYVSAKRLIADAVERRQQGGSSNSQLAGVSQNPWPESVKVMETGVPKVWRLVAFETDGPQEIVFRIQGILVVKNLPPVERGMSKNTKAKYLRQSIILAGLGNDTFDEAIRGLDKVEAMFARYIGADDVQPNTLVSSFRGEKALELSNRYFVPAVIARNGDEPALELGPEIDPRGFLKNAAGQDYVHTAENVVKYRLLKCTEKAAQRFEAISPKCFQVGDIVEGLLSLLAVKTDVKSSKYKVVASLRGITLLNGAVTEAANLQRRLRTKPGEGTSVKLKRIIDDDEYEEVREVRPRMDSSAG